MQSPYRLHLGPAGVKHGCANGAATATATGLHFSSMFEDFWSQSEKKSSRFAENWSRSAGKPRSDIGSHRCCRENSRCPGENDRGQREIRAVAAKTIAAMAKSALVPRKQSRSARR